MAVTLRLARHGQTKRPFYRVVAAEKKDWRDGRFLEVVGTYNPMENPAAVAFKEDRVRKWIDVGAQTSPIVRNLIAKHIPGLIEEKETQRRAKIQAARRARKSRAKAK